MIRQIQGVVVDASPTHIVVDVGGIGYLISTTAKMNATLAEKVTLYTYLSVRENALDLYGFKNKEDLAFFELLLTLPKVGPKTAVAILSQADVSLLRSTIISQDATHLSKMSGMSKKTAEKVVLGLKDRFEGDFYESDETKDNPNRGGPPFVSDTIDALITLGYPQADARKTIQRILSEKPEITSANDAIKEALKMLN